MERRLRKEEVMTIEVLAERGVAKRAIARTLGVAESSVRYRLARAASGAVDGRSRQASAAVAWAEPIAVWMAEQEAEGPRPESRGTPRLARGRARPHTEPALVAAIRRSALPTAEAACAQTGRDAARRPGPGRLVELAAGGAALGLGAALRIGTD